MKPNKPPIPDLDFSPEDLTPDELNKLDAPIKKWCCCIEGCDRFTRIKDVWNNGSVSYWWRRRWVNLARNVFFCATHWKIYKKHGKTWIPPNGYKPGPGLNHLK